MPYTLAKFFIWGLLLALGGGIIGWLLRSLKARAEVARARTSTVDTTEVARLRGRLANLEPVVAERDRLRMELADVRGKSAGALGFSSIATMPSEEPSPTADESGDDAAGPTDAAIEPDDTATEAASEPAPGDAVEPAAVAEPALAAAVEPGTESDSAAAPSAAAALDLDAAADVLGKKPKLDDLTVVEGIGPKIAQLCGGIGITTWLGLAGTDVAELQSMLDAAGSRFQMHKPATWPQQAGLLASGKWAEFKALTDSLTGGT